MKNRLFEINNPINAHPFKSKKEAKAFLKKHNLKQFKVSETWAGISNEWVCYKGWFKEPHTFITEDNYCKLCRNLSMDNTEFPQYVYLNSTGLDAYKINSIISLIMSHRNKPVTYDTGKCWDVFYKIQMHLRNKAK
jgi:hypothetical protein